MHRFTSTLARPILPVLLVALGTAGCGPKTAAGADAGTPRDDRREVVVATAEPAPFPRTALLQGTLEPDHTVQLASRVEGPLLDVRVDLGDTVRRGALLARIDATDSRTRLAQAEIDLATARTDLARYQGLDPVDAVSQQAIAEAQSRVDAASSAVALARSSVSYTRVVAPWDGAVQRRLVERGAFVRVGTPLFDLVSTGPLRLGLEVPELYFADVHEGTIVYVLPGQDAEPRFEAHVTRIAPAINAATRTFRIEATVETQDGLRPGMFVVAVLALGLSEDAVRVPRSAVFSVLGRDRVMRVVDEKAIPTEVEFLGERDGYAFVRHLDAGAVVVSRGGNVLAPETRVRIGTGAVPRPVGAANTGGGTRVASTTDAGASR